MGDLYFFRVFIRIFRQMGLGMELTYSELRQKEIINICDGKRLGRISDLVFNYPQNIVTGIVVPGCRRQGFFRSAPELFISMGCITKIGEDVILVNLSKASSGSAQGGGKGGGGCLYLSSDASSAVSASADKSEDLE